MMSFLLFCVLFALSFPCSEAVDYYVDPIGGRSCDMVCQQHNKVCTGTGHGLSPVSARPVFHRLGITCGPENETDFYTSRDSPAYVRLEKESYDLCTGFKEIPYKIDCAAAGTNQNVKRLCPCVRGNFVQFQNIPTLEGCTNVEHFAIDGKLYLAFSRLRAYRLYRSATQIFRLEGYTFVLHQTLKTTYSGPEQAKYFHIDGSHYMAIPYLKPPKTVIFQWNKNNFQSYQELDCGLAALSTTFFEINASKYLAIYGYNVIFIYVWNGYDFIRVHTLTIRKAFITECKPFQPRNVTYLTCAVWGGLEKSLVFKWTGTRFILHQEILGVEYASSAELMQLDNQTTALILAQRQRGSGADMLKVRSPVYIWSSGKSIFELDKSLSVLTQGASACRPFRIGEDLYLIVAQSGAKKSVIYRYQGGRFVVYQKLRAAFADDATFFTYQRTHYIALATKNMRSSPVFMWN